MFSIVKRLILAIEFTTAKRITSAAAALTYSTLLAIVPILAVVFAIAGIFGRFLAEWISVWLFFSGVVVSAVAVIILFGKNDCFIHDIATDNN